MAVKEIALVLSAADPFAADRTLEALLSEFEKPILRLCFRLLGNLADAQDAAQEVFLKAHRHRDRLDPARPAGPWLYQVAYNQCRDRMRRRRPSVALEDIGPLAAAGNPEAQAVQNERRDLVLVALEILGDKERAALVLRDLEGMDTREVAAVLGTREETVRSQISMARAKMRKYLTSRNAL